MVHGSGPYISIFILFHDIIYPWGTWKLAGFGEVIIERLVVQKFYIKIVVAVSFNNFL